jgi:putative peptidoglycan lipid II flippase
MAALSRPVVNLLFEHGATTSSDASSISKVLLAYLPGTLFAAYDQILIYMFYSRRSTWVPVLVGVASVCAYFACAFLLADRFGAVGLATANSVQFIAHTFILAGLARKRVARIVGTTWRAIGVIMAASTASAIGAFASARAVDAVVSGQIGEVVVVVVPAGIGTVIYAAGVLMAGVPEAQEIRNSLMTLTGLRPRPAV